MLSRTNYYVYMLCDPRSLNKNQMLKCQYSPFYVGKGKGNRAYKHLTAPVKQSFLKNKIQKIRSEGFEPIIEFYKIDLSEDEAFSIEKTLIASLGRINYDPNGILVNLAEGGKGGSGGVRRSAETRAKMSAAKQQMTEEHKMKISLNHRHNKMCRLRKPDGEVLIVEGLTRFCRENGLEYQPLRNSIRFGKPVRSGASLGWTLLEFID